MSKKYIPGYGRRVKVIENPGELMIKCRWSKRLGLIYFIPVIVIGALAFINFPRSIKPETVFLLLLPAGFLFYLFYTSLCLLFNTTVITCNAERLNVRSGPFPVFDKKTILSSEIYRFYTVDQIVSERKNFFRDPIVSRQLLYSSLCLYDKKGRKRTLIKYLPKKKMSQFLEQKLEKFYGVEPRVAENLF